MFVDQSKRYSTCRAFRPAPDCMQLAANGLQRSATKSFVEMYCGCIFWTRLSTALPQQSKTIAPLTILACCECSTYGLINIFQRSANENSSSVFVCVIGQTFISLLSLGFEKSKLTSNLRITSLFSCRRRSDDEWLHFESVVNPLS